MDGGPKVFKDFEDEDGEKYLQEKAEAELRAKLAESRASEAARAQ